jgi:hypothetical protein
MTNPYDKDDRKEMMRRYRDIGSTTGVVWGGIALAVLIALGAIFFFTSDTGTSTAVSTGSGSSQSSPNTTGSGPSR